MATIQTMREVLGVRVLPRIDENDSHSHVVAFHLPGLRFEPVAEFHELDDALAEANRLRLGLES